jgi:hypothetical protein
VIEELPPEPPIRTMALSITLGEIVLFLGICVGRFLTPPQIVENTVIVPVPGPTVVQTMEGPYPVRPPYKLCYVKP